MVLAGVFVLPGCVPPPPATAPTGAHALLPSETVAVGDWDDADAAVRTAVRTEQMAIERRSAYRSVDDAAPSVLVYELRTVRGDSGELRLKDLGENRIRVRCRVGALGSPEAEGRVVSAVVERLKKLHGKDYAPG